MKKLFLCVLSLVMLIFVIFLSVEYIYSKDKIQLVGELSNNEYCSRKMYFYNSVQDGFDAVADLIGSDSKITALGENAKVQFKLAHKPISVYELSADEKSGKVKIEYDKANKVYTLSDLYENEVCEYGIIVDYGIVKNFYCFQVYNKTYIEKNIENESTVGLTNSRYDFSGSSRNIIISLNYNEFPYDTMNFGFTICNMNNKNMTCSFFKLEKKIGDNWYGLEERDMSYNMSVYDKIKQQVECTLEPNEKRSVNLQMNIDTLFDMAVGNNLLSGTYRLVIPFKCEDEIAYSVSSQFTIGYLP